MEKKIIIAITGASGSIYAKRLIDKLKNHKDQPKMALIFSETAKIVWKTEIGSNPEFNIKVYDENDFMAPFASGSSVWDSMVVVPCTMGSLGKISGGIADNLITRAADVFLKEQKQLILVPREMPYNLIHLENMKNILLAGGMIIPANPSFYSKPQSIEEIVDTVVYRIMDQLGFKENHSFRW